MQVVLGYIDRIYVSARVMSEAEIAAYYRIRNAATSQMHEAEPWYPADGVPRTEPLGRTQFVAMLDDGNFRPASSGRRNWNSSRPTR